MCFVWGRSPEVSYEFCTRHFIFVKTTKLALKRKREVIPKNMHVAGLFTGSNGLVYLWGPLYYVGKRVDFGRSTLFRRRYV
jgi:hypothetical protein